MTGDGIIRDMRVRLGDVDGILSSADIDYSDSYLFEYIESSNDILTSTGIITETYVVSGATISPSPSTIDGLLLSAHSTFILLSSDINKKVKDGEMGIRFKSGQDEISTTEAAKQLKNAADESYKEFRRLVMAKFAGDSTTMERLQ